jgi:hypothetical protein
MAGHGQHNPFTIAEDLRTTIENARLPRIITLFEREEGEQDPPMDELCDAIREVQTNEDYEMVINYLVIKIMIVNGYQPDLFVIKSTVQNMVQVWILQMRLDEVVTDHVKSSKMADIQKDVHAYLDRVEVNCGRMQRLQITDAHSYQSTAVTYMRSLVDTAIECDAPGNPCTRFESAEVMAPAGVRMAEQYCVIDCDTRLSADVRTAVEEEINRIRMQEPGM